MADKRIPVTIVTGFLGAGKTTLLNRVLSHEAFSNAAVLINEFGEVSVDHLIVSSVSDDVTELADGCMCCAVRGKMVDALRAFAERVNQPSRVIIETSGLADPAPVAEALLRDEILAHTFQPAMVVTVVNLAETETLLDHQEATRQIAFADAIILTRAERLGETDRHGAAARISSVNPTAELFSAIAPDELAALLTRDVATLGLSGTRQMPTHDHGHGTARSLVLSHDSTLPLNVVTGFCDWVLARSGMRLLRLKGTVETPEGHYLLQAVGRTLEEPARLPSQKHAVPNGTMLVLIGEGLDIGLIKDTFASFTGQPVLDRPDRAALEDNPLSISGFSFNG